jgi:hypothetical protein
MVKYNKYDLSLLLEVCRMKHHKVDRLLYLFDQMKNFLPDLERTHETKENEFMTQRMSKQFLNNIFISFFLS